MVEVGAAAATGKFNGFPRMVQHVAQGTMSSRCDIEVLRLRLHTVTKVGAEQVGSVHTDFAAIQQPSQLHLHAGEPDQSGHVARCELLEHVDVAFRSEVLSQGRAEQRKPAYVMLPAEAGDFF